MKKIFLLFLMISGFSYAQIELKGTMGINFLSVPSMQDYINFFHPDDQLGSFNSAVVFSIEGGHFISHSFLVSLEGAYQLFSYTNLSTAGKYEMVYKLIPITAMGYYVIRGDGYNLKFGGGIGPRFVTAEESLPGLGTTDNYNSIGAGFILRCEGNTLLGGNFYANLGADLKYDFNGEPENNGEKLTNSVYGQNVNFNTFALGVKLGVSYLIGAN
ncbi:MAG: hypothetical protein P8X47_08075 [Ignavibacteriaceae bacterium]